MTYSDAQIIQTGCKINLYLSLRAKRKDGYHELESLMYPLSEPHDVLRCSPGGASGRLSISCPAFPELETPDNILYRVWNVVQHYSDLPGIHVELEKHIPQGAGLGGGSANAAGFLKYLLTLLDRPDQAEHIWQDVATEIGADVPFFLFNRPAIVRGIGERLSPLPFFLTGYTLLLIFPAISISTKFAYDEWDRWHATHHSTHESSHSPFLDLSTQSLTSPCADYTNFSPLKDGLVFFNSFEDAIFRTHPALQKIKEDLWRSGASAALMSGSGSTLFALYEEGEQGKEAQTLFHKRGIQTFLQKIEDTGVSPRW